MGEALSIKCPDQEKISILFAYQGWFAEEGHEDLCEGKYNDTETCFRDR